MLKKLLQTKEMIALSQVRVLLSNVRVPVTL